MLRSPLTAHFGVDLQTLPDVIPTAILQAEGGISRALLQPIEANFGTAPSRYAAIHRKFIFLSLAGDFAKVLCASRLCGVVQGAGMLRACNHGFPTS